MTLPKRSSNNCSNKNITKTKKKDNNFTNLLNKEGATHLRLKASMTRLRGSAASSFKQRVVKEIKSTSSKSKNGSFQTHRFERRRNLSSMSRNILHSWLVINKHNPYPSDQQKKDLAEQAEVSVEQVGTWFVNARVRTLPKLLGHQPMKKKQRRKN